MIEFQLASYAVNEEKSRGRLYVEVFDDLKFRSTFGHDKARIVNSSAFRRLQYKTQVLLITLMTIFALVLRTHWRLLKLPVGLRVP